ncbi:MAG: response regulator transcription factor [Cyclobacteriaceae bacterium]
MKKKPTILIVEDKPLLAEDLVDRLEHFGYEHILGPFASGEKTIDYLEQTDAPDVAILDIRLTGELSGIDVARYLSSKGDTSIIFLTSAQDELVLNESLSVGPVAFLNKPFTNNEMKAVLHNALHSIGKAMPREDVTESSILDDRIFVRNGRGKYFILLENILWIKSNGGDTSVIMTIDRLGKKDNELPVIGLNLAKIEERLSFFPFLVRASRYYIINIKKVERILDHQKGSSGLKKAVLIAENEIVLGDRYRKRITDMIHQL